MKTTVINTGIYEKCSVCYEEIRDDATISTCFHVFHKKCLTNYRNHIFGKARQCLCGHCTPRIKCPMCRELWRSLEDNTTDIDEDPNTGTLEYMKMRVNEIIEENKPTEQTDDDDVLRVILEAFEEENDDPDMIVRVSRPQQSRPDIDELLQYLLMLPPSSSSSSSSSE